MNKYIFECEILIHADDEENADNLIRELLEKSEGYYLSKPKLMEN